MRGAATKGSTANATGQLVANVAAANANSTVAYQVYGGSWSSSVPLNNATIGMDGNNVAHANMQPYAVVNFTIALFGIYPSRN